MMRCTLLYVKIWRNVFYDTKVPLYLVPYYKKHEKYL